VGKLVNKEVVEGFYTETTTRRDQRARYNYVEVLIWPGAEKAGEVLAEIEMPYVVYRDALGDAAQLAVRERLDELKAMAAHKATS
jgi:hypothetical protein